MPGQQLVEDGAKSINICRVGELRIVSHCLFRRHVTGRAQHFHRARDRALSLDQSRQTKIGQMRFAFLIEQNVSRFDVTMKDAVLVRVMNRPRYLGD